MNSTGRLAAGLHFGDALPVWEQLLSVLPGFGWKNSVAGLHRVRK